MRETLLLLYDKTIKDGHEGRKFPIFWRRMPGSSRAFIAVLKEIEQKFSNDPRYPNLEYITDEHGLQSGPMNSQVDIEKLRFLVDYYERDYHTIVTPFSFQPRHENQWLLLSYRINPEKYSWGAVDARKFPVFWDVTSSRLEHEIVKANIVGDIINRGMPTDDIIFVESRNGYAKANDTREVVWDEMLEIAQRHIAEVSPIHRDCINRFLRGK